MLRTKPFGDPQHTAGTVLDLVEMHRPPLRLLLRAHALPLVGATHRARIHQWRSHVTLAAQTQ